MIEEREFKVILKEYPKENGIKQKEFAEVIGVKSGQVCEWVKGKAKPSYENLRAIAKAYDGAIEYFLGLKDEY